MSLFTLLLEAQTILVINSNGEVKKYTEAVDEFSKNVNMPFKMLDISKMSSNDIKRSLYDKYPDIVYAVGAKAYQYANEYLPEKEIYFSSIIDWKRLSLDGKRYGISNELHSSMQLTLVKSIFNNIKTIGIVHSKYTQNIINDLRQDAEKLGIKILPLAIDADSVNNMQFDDVIKNSDAMMIIADPLFLNNEKAVEKVFHLSKEYKKPVVAYHELFIQYGATLVISADNPTIGRQIASMMESNSNNEKIEEIQYPAGTNVIFNQKEAVLNGVEFNPDVILFTTAIVE
jgi:putative ABC transport system substrate-binding protein